VASLWIAHGGSPAGGDSSFPLPFSKRAFAGDSCVYLPRPIARRSSSSRVDLRAAEAFDRFLRLLKTKKWVICVKRPFGSPEHVLKYLAHYTHRIAISNGRLIAVENGQVTFRWRDSADHNTQKIITLEAVEFIRRFLMHVLPAGFVKIRHCGLLANRHCQASLALCRSLLRSPQNVVPDLVTELRLRAVRRNCPVCQHGTLHIIGWFPPGAAIPAVSPMNMDSS